MKARWWIAFALLGCLTSCWVRHANDAPALDRVDAAVVGVLDAVAEYCDATGTEGAWLGGGEAPVGISFICPAGAKKLAEAMEQPTPATERGSQHQIAYRQELR